MRTGRGVGAHHGAWGVPGVDRDAAGDCDIAPQVLGPAVGVSLRALWGRLVVVAVLEGVEVTLGVGDVAEAHGGGGQVVVADVASHWVLLGVQAVVPHLYVTTRNKVRHSQRCDLIHRLVNEGERKQTDFFLSLLFSFKPELRRLVDGQIDR